MTTPVIIDIVVAAILLGSAAFGAKRGLLRTLAGFVIVVVALIGAGMIAATFSGPAAKLAAPVIEKQIESKVDDALAAETGKVQMPEADLEGGFQIEDLLELLGLDREVRTSLAEQARETVRDTGVSIAAAVVESIAQSMIYGVLYLVSFLALLLLLRVLLRAMDLVFKLPGLHGLNALGGALLGLTEGALLLFLSVWLLRKLGVSFETGALAEAHILHIFTANTPLSVLSFLQ